MTDQDTRHRIIRAAAALFVENGFQKTTVRSICQAAGANVAAVNYHFRDKKGLYGAVIQYAFDLKPEIEDDPTKSIAERLRVWIATLVNSCVGQEPDLLSQIMVNEMARPTGFLQVILEQMIGPRVCLLEGIITEAMGGSPCEKRVQLLAMSVVGQALLYDHCRAAVDLMMPEMDYSEEKLNHLIDHITRASVGMIEAFKGDQ